MLQWDCPECRKENLVNHTVKKVKYRTIYQCRNCQKEFWCGKVKRYQVSYWMCCGNPVMDNGYVCCREYTERDKPMINNSGK